MKQTMIIIAVVLSVCNLSATPQSADMLVYNGDTLLLYAHPLEQWKRIDSKREKLFEGRKVWVTDCGRDYQAEWIIENGQLYLTGILSCNYDEDKLKADLKKLFGNKYINGKVTADWFTGDLIVPQGKRLYYFHHSYGWVYEKELVLVIKKWKLVDTKIYDNSKTKMSIYSQDNEKLSQWIYSNIRWDSLPMPGTGKVRVIVHFSVNEEGIIYQAKVTRSDDERFNEEAIRVVKTIPEWDVYYKRGKYQRMSWRIPIIFSHEIREVNKER